MSSTAQSPGLGFSFFPSPQQNTHRDAPKLWPGVSAESESELANLLRLNNEKHHIQWNDQGFHNHLTHHLFAAYAMGSSPDVLTAAYKQHAEYQKAAYKSPSEITESTWTHHLGKWDYYNAYMHFYAAQITAHGPSATLQKFVFAKEANLSAEGEVKGGPQMLDRFMNGLLHPMIHAGHWAEFHVPGMLAEGLALTSITSPSSPQLFPPSFFSPPPHTSPPPAPHALTLLQEIFTDPLLAPGTPCTAESSAKYSDTLRSAGTHIHDTYTSRWTIDSPSEIPSKLEELVYLVVLVYGLGGWRQGKDFKADFFLVHLLNSSLFLPSYLPHLSFPSQRLLLRAHLSLTLTYYISRGRPPIPLSSYYSTSPSTLLPPALSQIHPSDSALAPQALPANPWLPILTSALNHPEEHLLKAQRALAHFDHLYAATTPQGYFHGKTTLTDSEMLDGSIFARVALHTQTALGWVREGEPLGGFDRDGLGWDHLWN